MKVGLFGGSFDPPHAGHLALARNAMAGLGLDRVVWLVSPGNPLKQSPSQDLARRMAATQALAGHGRMIISDIEARLGSVYSVDTARALKRRHPGVHFVWLMGADSLAGLHRWRAWRALAHEVPIAVFARDAFKRRALLSPAARTIGPPLQAARRIAYAKPPAFAFFAMRLRPEASRLLRASGAAKSVL